VRAGGGRGCGRAPLVPVARIQIEPGWVRVGPTEGGKEGLGHLSGEAGGVGEGGEVAGGLPTHPHVDNSVAPSPNSRSTTASGVS